MIGLFRKLIFRKHETGIAAQVSILRTTVSQVRDEVDKILRSTFRLGLFIPLEKASWDILTFLDEKGDFRQDRPRYLKHALGELAGREFLSTRMYDLEANHLREKDPYLRVSKRGRIRCSAHFPIVVTERVIGELAVYTREPLTKETNQALTLILKKYEGNLSEIILGDPKDAKLR